MSDHNREENEPTSPEPSQGDERLYFNPWRAARRRPAAGAFCAGISWFTLHRSPTSEDERTADTDSESHESASSDGLVPALGCLAVVMIVGFFLILASQWTKLTAPTPAGKTVPEQDLVRLKAIVAQERGGEHFERKEYDQALEAYDEALRHDPKFVLAYVGKGMVYLMRQDLEKAIAALNKAIALDPQSDLAYGLRSVAFSKKGDAVRAEADRKKAHDLHPCGDP